MPKIDLTPAEFETMLYALGVAEADLVESVACNQQSEEDRKEWTQSLEETRALLAKLEAFVDEAEAA